MYLRMSQGYLTAVQRVHPKIRRNHQMYPESSKLSMTPILKSPSVILGTTLLFLPKRLEEGRYRKPITNNNTAVVLCQKCRYVVLAVGDSFMEDLGSRLLPKAAMHPLMEKQLPSLGP